MKNIGIVSFIIGIFILLGNMKSDVPNMIGMIFLTIGIGFVGLKMISEKENKDK